MPRNNPGLSFARDIDVGSKWSHTNRREGGGLLIGKD